MLLVQFFKALFVVIACNVDIVIGSPTLSQVTDPINSTCPLWHSVDQVNGHCECCFTFSPSRIVQCKNNHIEILQGNCMTWNNSTQDVEVGRCLFIYKDHYLKDPCYNCSSYYWHTIYSYSIPTNISGSELNRFVCSG